MSNPLRDRRRRGNALIVVMIALALLGFLAAGVIIFTGQERVAAVDAARAAQVKACAETARNALIAKLRAFGAPQGFTLELLDETVVTKRSQTSTSHYGETDADAGIEIVSAGVGAQSKQVRDLTNIVAGQGSLGPKYYRITVHCDSRDKESEMEFMVRVAGI